jgi:hypothetical protein
MRMPIHRFARILLAPITPALALLLYGGMARADYDVRIAAGTSAQGAWSGSGGGGDPAIWTPSGSGAVVSVSEIVARLGAGQEVRIVTSGGGSEAGDLTVQAPLAWSAGLLGLQALGDIRIDAVLTASTAAELSLQAGGSVRARLMRAGFVGRVEFPGRSGAGFLSINGQGYTVLNSLGTQAGTEAGTLKGINSALGGHYALGAPIDASATAGWNTGKGFAPIGSGAAPFTGVLDGLGHTVDGLTVFRSGEAALGLLGAVQNGTVRNIGVVGGEVGGGGTGTNGVGALVGILELGKVHNSYATAQVSAMNASRDVGGLVGVSIGGSIDQSFAAGDVIATFDSKGVGGLVGYVVNSGAKIARSFALGNVWGDDDIEDLGGLVGATFDGGTIHDSYATGNVQGYTGAKHLGGLIGRTDAGLTISNTYAAGQVGGNGTSLTGGLVGKHDNAAATASNNFWDTSASGQNASAVGAGKTTAEMQAQATYTGWDFDQQWSIAEGTAYPVLRWELPPPADSAPTASDVAISSSTPTVGQLLTGSYTYADADNDPEGASTFVWKRGSTPIGGATALQYTPVADDAGQALTFCVTPVASTGTATGAQACSVPSAPVVLAPLAGACGAAAGQPTALVPATGLCSVGTPGAVASATGQYTWQCQGLHGGSASSCQAPWANAGSASATVALQTGNNWQVSSASFSTTPPAAAPQGVTFPAGLLALNLSSGTQGSDATVTLQFTTPIPAGAVYMKYGPSPEGFNCQGTAACAQPHWYELPASRVEIATNRQSATLTLTDGGLGDFDGIANQFIQDPGGFAVKAAPAPTGPQAIPTLSEWGVLLLSALAAAFGLRAARRRG